MKSWYASWKGEIVDGMVRRAEGCDLEVCVGMKKYLTEQGATAAPSVNVGRRLLAELGRSGWAHEQLSHRCSLRKQLE